jgi:predicted phosphodiesterase
VIAGDLLNMFPCHGVPLPDQVRDVQDWLKTLPKPAVVCTGNHDIWMRHPRAAPDVMAEGGWLQACKRPNLVVDGQTANIQDERFAVVKWGDANWPDDATIVVSHAPPSEARVSINAEGTDWGDFEISMRVWEKRPKYVLSGHVHQPVDWAVLEGASWCLNPGCDMEAAEPNHIFIDTTKKMARWHTMRRGFLVKRLDG